VENAVNLFVLNAYQERKYAESVAKNIFALIVIGKIVDIVDFRKNYK